MPISPSSHVSQRRTSAGIRNTLSALVAVPTSLRVCVNHTTNYGDFILINAPSQEKGSTWRQGSCSVGVAMESHMEPHVEGMAQRLEEMSCGWRLWTNSGTLTASPAL